jgi:hypothetical protein
LFAKHSHLRAYEIAVPRDQGLQIFGPYQLLCVIEGVSHILLSEIHDPFASFLGAGLRDLGRSLKTVHRRFRDLHELIERKLSLFKTAFRKVNFEIVRLPHDCVLHHWFATGGTSALAMVLVVYR